MTRNDNDFDSKIESTNSELTKICEVRDWNANIDETCLNGSGLHLNGKGDSLLASNPTNALRGKGHNSPSGHSSGSRFTKLNYRGSNFQERDAKIVWNFLQLMGRQRWVMPLWPPGVLGQRVTNHSTRKTAAIQPQYISTLLCLELEASN